MNVLAWIVISVIGSAMVIGLMCIDFLGFLVCVGGTGLLMWAILTVTS